MRIKVELTTEEKQDAIKLYVEDALNLEKGLFTVKEVYSSLGEVIIDSYDHRQEFNDEDD